MLKLVGKNVYLVLFEKRHLNDPQYFKWLRDYEVMKTIGRAEYIVKPIEFEDVKKYLENIWKNHKKYIFFALYYKKDKVFIGTIKVNITNPKTKEADIGIMIGEKKYWGKGLATDGIFTVCKYCFEKLKLRRLTAACMAVNLGMIKVFKRLGFVQEGLFRKRDLYEGEYIDHVYFSCFLEDFNKNR